MHRILVISRFLAPSSAVGGKRFSYLMREFEARGMDVRAVTTALDSQDTPDMTLPASGGVFRTLPHTRLLVGGAGFTARALNRLAKTLLAPLDTDPLWIGPATRLGRQLAAEAPRGVIIGTIPPLSAGTVAARIARSSGWPLILDYRDPWTAYPWDLHLRGWYSRALATRLEGRYIAASAARAFNTPEMRDWFQRYFPGAAAEWNFVIPNGLDVTETASSRVSATDPEIVHAGAIYGDRSLVPVLRALATSMAAHPRVQPLRVVVYGKVRDTDIARIRQEGLERLLVVRPRISHVELQAVLKRARALLIVSGRQMGYSIPYKTYDYLAARRPILALAPAGSAVQRFMREFAVGEHADPADEDAVQRALARVVLSEAAADTRALEAHRWSHLADEYVHVIDRVSRHAQTAGGRTHAE
jgi:hypothetical protein